MTCVSWNPMAVVTTRASSALARGVGSRPQVGHAARPCALGSEEDAGAAWDGRLGFEMGFGDGGGRGAGGRARAGIPIGELRSRPFTPECFKMARRCGVGGADRE